MDLQPEALVGAGGGGALPGPRASPPFFDTNNCRQVSLRWHRRRRIHEPHGRRTGKACRLRRIRQPGLS